VGLRGALAVEVYAHWLDPEFLDALDHKAGMLERSLKVHALLGDTLILSDVQLIDSPIVFRLFANEDFRQFLRDFPDFVQVVAQPTQGNDRYAIVARSLERATRKGWVPSSVKIPGLVTEFSRVILEKGWVDPDLWHTRDGKRLLANAGEHANDLRGILNCLDHFANGDRHVIVRTPPDPTVETFYDVLIELRNRTDLESDHRRQVEGTLDWIQENLDPDDWNFRSPVISRIGGPPWTPEQQMIRNTVNQAWNCAVETTIDPEAGSTGYLPYSPPIGVYRHVPYNGLLAVDKPSGRVSQIMSSLHDRVRAVSWDPLAISWARLREITTETSDERFALQIASFRPDYNDLLEQLITAISAQEHDYLDRDPASSTMLVEAAGAAGGGAIGVLFGAGAGTAAAIAAAGVIGTYGAKTVMKRAFRWSRRFRIVNTLRHELSAVSHQSP
jgi:hypothetical protein